MKKTKAASFRKFRRLRKERHQIVTIDKIDLYRIVQKKIKSNRLGKGTNDVRKQLMNLTNQV